MGARNCIEFRSGLIDADTRLHSSDHPQVTSPLSTLKAGKGAVVLQKRPDLSFGRQNVLKRSWHHSDYGKAVATQRDLTSDDCALAVKATTPKSFADDD